MWIPKRILSGAKCATLLAMSWSVGIALESRFEAVPAFASTTLAQAATATPAPLKQAPSWWKLAT